jgi:hypothetical protein
MFSGRYRYGDARGKCVMVDVGMGTFAKGSDHYMILEGY